VVESLELGRTYRGVVKLISISIFYHNLRGKISGYDQYITETAKEEGLEKGLKKGRIEGREEGKLEMAKNLLLMGLDVEVVAKAAGVADL
jgi:predicted transposase/invertase (TIGR01784 family)